MFLQASLFMPTHSVCYIQGRKGEEGEEKFPYSVDGKLGDNKIKGLARGRVFLPQGKKLG